MDMIVTEGGVMQKSENIADCVYGTLIGCYTDIQPTVIDVRDEKSSKRRRVTNPLRRLIKSSK